MFGIPRPHKFCGYYTHETATIFSGFYDLVNPRERTLTELRRSRLMLAELTSTVLTLGSPLLGVETSDRL